MRPKSRIWQSTRRNVGQVGGPLLNCVCLFSTIALAFCSVFFFFFWKEYNFVNVQKIPTCLVFRHPTLSELTHRTSLLHKAPFDSGQVEFMFFLFHRNLQSLFPILLSRSLSPVWICFAREIGGKAGHDWGNSGAGEPYKGKCCPQAVSPLMWV